ncbi:uncharacterized protein LOC108740926 [Agrilus planipennis]|uniref:Uncharacterized protein LOC108740926 n=1 Tax=Agrilus planipennis TaxID=224129 RepID=A0A1W4XEU0_AGRPL|nr:uncharacterized protein LOC108740926 [Agrilus planipennis]
MDKSTERRRTLIFITIVILFVLTIVLTALFVLFLVEEGTQQIILLILLGLMILVGILACAVIEAHRRKAAVRKEQSAHLWIQRTFHEQREQYNPSAPPMSARTSWALTSPWKSHRETSLPPYSPPHSPRNNR